jgi:hypothetical protein
MKNHSVTMIADGVVDAEVAVVVVVVLAAAAAAAVAADLPHVR